MKKKALSLCLALALFFALPFCMPTAKALSSGNYTVRLNEAYALAGETVDIEITVEGDADFSSMQCLLQYDQTRLSLVTDEGGVPAFKEAEGFAARSLTNTFEEQTHAHAVAFFVETENRKPAALVGETRVLTLSFLVKGEAAPGDAAVKLLSFTDTKSFTFVSGGEGVYGSASYMDGKVTVLPEGYERITGENTQTPYTVTTVVDGVVTKYAVNRSKVSFPGSVTQNGRVVAVWLLDEKPYVPGAVLALPRRDVILTAVTVEAPRTVHGAAVKITPKPNDTALRFKVTINRENYDALVALLGEESVSWGMIAAPQQNIDFAGACTYEAFEEYVEEGKQPYVCYPPKEEWANKKNKGTFSNFYVNEDGDVYTLIGAIGNFHNANLRSGVRFNAVGYIAVRIDGSTFYVYGDVDFTAARDVAYVVNCALAAYLADRAIYTEDQIKWLKALKERCES